MRRIAYMCEIVVMPGLPKVPVQANYARIGLGKAPRISIRFCGFALEHNTRKLRVPECVSVSVKRVGKKEEG